MANKTETTKDEVSEDDSLETSPDNPLLDFSKAAVETFIRTVKKRGYVTHDQITSLSKELNSEQVEEVLAMFNEMGVNVVETEEGSEAAQGTEPEEEGEAGSGELIEVHQKVSAKSEAKEPAERTDDPVRMYLRDMGSMELLSREGEIAIAKRIEAGRETMIAGLCESPLTFQAIVIWRDELNEGKVFLRDIIDLEATYAGPHAKAMPEPAIGPDGQPVLSVPGVPIPGAPALAQTAAPPAAPAAATPFNAANDDGEVRGCCRRRLRRRRHGGLALVRGDRGRAQAQGARDLRQNRRELQAAAPAAGPGHRVQAQEHHALARAGAALQEA